VLACSGPPVYTCSTQATPAGGEQGLRGALGAGSLPWHACNRATGTAWCCLVYEGLVLLTVLSCAPSLCIMSCYGHHTADGVLAVAVAAKVVAVHLLHCFAIVQANMHGAAARAAPVLATGYWHIALCKRMHLSVRTSSTQLPVLASVT
jgi:hypothetical protein